MCACVSSSCSCCIPTTHSPHGLDDPSLLRNALLQHQPLWKGNNTPLLLLLLFPFLVPSVKARFNLWLVSLAATLGSCLSNSIPGRYLRMNLLVRIPAHHGWCVVCALRILRIPPTPPQLVARAVIPPHAFTLYPRLLAL